MAEAGISRFPSSAEIGLGIGPIAIPVFGEAKHTSRFHVLNKNGSPVGTSVFSRSSMQALAQFSAQALVVRSHSTHTP